MSSRKSSTRGGQAVANYDSVATPEGGKAIVQTALDAYGTVDILINNAGNIRNAPFTELTPDSVETLLAVHVKGAFSRDPAVRRPSYDWVTTARA